MGDGRVFGREGNGADLLGTVRAEIERIVGIVVADEEHAAAFRTERAGEGFLHIVVAAVGVQQMQLILSAVEVVVEVLVLLVAGGEGEVGAGVVCVFQRGKVVVDALHIVVQIVDELIHHVRSLDQIAQQIHNACDQLAADGAVVGGQSFEQTLQVADLLAGVVHIAPPY